MMITLESVIILVLLRVPFVLSTEHCPSTTQFNVTWPQIPVRTNFVKDCSEINSSWTGDFTAHCIIKRGGNISWHFRGSCECEERNVLQYFTEKVSKVDQSNFLDTATELVNYERNFTNKEKFRGFLNNLKRLVCDRPPAIKTDQWDQIHLYCETTLTAVIDRNRSSHFDKYLCQKAQRSSSGDNVLVGDSFTARTNEAGVGETVVTLYNNSTQAVNISSVITNILKNFSTDGCVLLDFNMNDGQLTIRATEGKASTAKIRNNIELYFICVSLVAITCSFVALSCVRIQSSEKVFVHKNLLLAWALGYLVYILDVKAFTNRKNHLDICAAIAVTRHFFHTAVFTWMLVEAINLYIKLVKVISSKTFYVTYLAIGWGIPAVIVGITAAVTRARVYNMNQIQYKDFMCGSLKFTAQLLRDRCWLEGSKWIYAGPVLGILLVNLVLFIILLKVVLGKVASKYDNDKLMKTRKGLRGVATLLPVLGVTWLLGLLIEFHEVLAFSFVFLTSIQGIVFCVFHCILDDQVRNSLTQRFRRVPINT